MLQSQHSLQGSQTFVTGQASVENHQELDGTEMFPRLRAHTTLTEKLRPVPSTRDRWLKITYNSKSTGFSVSMGTQTPHTHKDA